MTHGIKNNLHGVANPGDPSEWPAIKSSSKRPPNTVPFPVKRMKDNVPQMLATPSEDVKEIPESSPTGATASTTFPATN